VVCWVVVWWVVLSVMVRVPFLAVRVVFGLNPMKEYLASFCGPSMDSRR
jgi:hypothetical protein